MRNLLILLIASVNALSAQNAISINDGDSLKSPPTSWWLLDPGMNDVPGISTQQAYGFLQGRTSQPVIVAVIDSGIDIEHEDLKDVIWTNQDEIAGNGMDDDHNG